LSVRIHPRLRLSSARDVSFVAPSTFDAVSALQTLGPENVKLSIRVVRPARIDGAIADASHTADNSPPRVKFHARELTRAQSDAILRAWMRRRIWHGFRAALPVKG